MLSLGCQLSTILRRRWWNSCRTPCISSTRSRLIPSRLSTCPRSLWRTSLRDACVVSHSWQNSWWKCRRSYPSLRCIGSWSRTSTFRFLPGQLRRLLSISLTTLLPVRQGQSSSYSLHLPAGFHEDLDGPGEGFFALFPEAATCGYTHLVFSARVGNTQHNTQQHPTTPNNTPQHPHTHHTHHSGFWSKRVAHQWRTSASLLHFRKP